MKDKHLIKNLKLGLIPQIEIYDIEHGFTMLPLIKMGKNQKNKKFSLFWRKK